MIGDETTLKDLLSRTPHGRAILGKLSGEDDYFGKFLPGLMKPLKKIGKVTQGITTAAAKITAAAFGIPPGAIDALAKLDPVAHTALLDKLSEVKKKEISSAAKKAIGIANEKKEQKQEEKKGIFQPLYIGIAAAIAALAGIAFLGKRKRG